MNILITPSLAILGDNCCLYYAVILVGRSDSMNAGFNWCCSGSMGQLGSHHSNSMPPLPLLPLAKRDTPTMGVMVSWVKQGLRLGGPKPIGEQGHRVSLVWAMNVRCVSERACSSPPLYGKLAFMIVLKTAKEVPGSSLFSDRRPRVQPTLCCEWRRQPSWMKENFNCFIRTIGGPPTICSARWAIKHLTGLCSICL